MADNLTSSLLAAEAAPTRAAPRRAARRRALVTGTLLAPALGVFAVLFVYPLGQVLLLSVSPGPTTRHYLPLAQSSLYIQVLWNTFKIAGEVAVLCLLIGYPMAYALVHAGRGLRRTLIVLILLPFWTSVLVRTYAWMVLLQKQGLLNKFLVWLGLVDEPLALMFNEIGVLVGMVHILSPFMIFPIYTALAAIDRNLFRAAQNLGAGPVRTFLRITLPLSLPGVGAGVLLVFVLAIGYFITPALLGGRKQLMVANLIEFQVTELLNWGFASALAITLLGATLAIYALYQRFFSLDRLWGGAARAS